MRALIMVDEVNVNNQTCHCVDRQGGRFEVSYAEPAQPALTVPKIGEQWIVEQTGYQWFLIERYESGDETVKLADLRPGDTRIGSTGYTRVSGRGLMVNDTPVGFMYWDRFDVPVGGMWQVNLTHAPISIKTVQAYNNERLVDPSLMRLIHNVLIGRPKVKFAEGNLIVYYQYSS